MTVKLCPRRRRPCGWQREGIFRERSSRDRRRVGVGRACAPLLHAQGRQVAPWDIAEEGAARVAIDLGSGTIALGLDVTDESAVATAVTMTASALGGIGGLVHAAGIVSQDAIGLLTAALWDSVVNLNLRAHAWLVQALLPYLRQASGAAVVAIASIEALVGHPAIPAYCASKSGLLGLTRSMALQLAPEGIRVNAVCPGYMDTPMLSGATAQDRIRLASVAPLGRLRRPDDIANAAAFLRSDAARFITGTYLVVGWWCHSGRLSRLMAAADIRR